tara:strand:+ start:578 stop:904 length:327 start_codon:yes stop_codon:yes gene_type:complete
MKKIGITLSIDVTKIDKTRLYAGNKGTYLDLTTFIDVEEEDQYGNHGFITQSMTKEEREEKVRLPILGNVRLIYNSESESKPSNVTNIQANYDPEAATPHLGEEDIPF